MRSYAMLNGADRRAAEMFLEEGSSMNNTERLRDEYEDAAFALLMDKIAGMEGERLIEENERLKNDPDAAVPEEIDRACRETIRKSNGKERKKAPRHNFGWFMYRIAAVLLVVIIALVVSYYTIPAVQAKVLNLLIETSTIDSTLILNKEDVGKDTAGQIPHTLRGYSLPNISDDFTISDYRNTEHEAWAEFSKQNGDKVSFSIAKKTSFFDSEDAGEIERIEVNGHEGMLVENDERVFLTWYDEARDNYLTLISNNVGRQYTLSLASEIVYVGE